MDERQVTVMVRSLKGAPASIVLAMLLLPPGAALGATQLARMTGYSDKPITQALQILTEMGLMQQHKRYSGWMLTVDARQLILGEMTPTLTEDGESEKFRLPCSCSSYNYTESESENFRLPTETTTTTTGESEIFRLPPEWEEALDMLINRCGCPGQTAKPAIQAAVERKELPAFVMWNMLRWLAYSLDTRRGNGIKNPPIFVASKVRSGELCPEWFEAPLHTEAGQEISALRRRWEAAALPEEESDMDIEPDVETAPCAGEPEKSSEASRLWQKALQELELQMTRATFDAWLHGTHALSIENGADPQAAAHPPVLVVKVKNPYAVDWLGGRLLPVIQRTMRRMTEKEWTFRFVV